MKKFLDRGIANINSRTDAAKQQLWSRWAGAHCPCCPHAWHAAHLLQHQALHQDIIAPLIGIRNCMCVHMASPSMSAAMLPHSGPGIT